jgi:hypothetical protein
MADPELLTAEGEEVLREEINRRIGGVCMCLAALLSSTPAGTGIELEVLFDAQVDNVLDIATLAANIDGCGPLLFVARTNMGYVLMNRVARLC